MVATLTRTKPPNTVQRRGRRHICHPVFEATIEGRFRTIPVRQLALAWWLYNAKHITLKQFRIYFAAHEMAEKRRYTKHEPGERPRTPTYTLEEIRRLIGSTDSETADKALTADVKKLGRMGLVQISTRSIHFATDIEQIELPSRAVGEGSGGDDTASIDFRGFFDQLPNNARRRKVPVPRRTVRALAKGLKRGEIGMMLAILIRSLYWHNPNTRKAGSRAGAPGAGVPKEGGFRVDGRTKCSWIAEVFGMDRKTVTAGRSGLIDRGWLRELECAQWELNKWGQRYTINVHAFAPTPRNQSPTNDAVVETEELLEAIEVEAGSTPIEPVEAPDGAPEPQETASCAAPRSGGGFPSPVADLSDTFPSPYTNQSSPSTKGYFKTRNPARKRSGHRTGGSREKKRRLSPPRLADIRAEDLADTGRLLELYGQAVAAGRPAPGIAGEAGRLNFVAFAEHARRCGDQPVRMFAWLVRQDCTEHITQEDEIAASARLKQHDRAGREDDALSERTSTRPRRVALQTRAAFMASLGDDERFVARCIAVGRANKVEPFRVARMKDWTRDRWDQAHMAYKLAEQRRWHDVDDDDTTSGGGGGFLNLLGFEPEE